MSDHAGGDDLWIGGLCEALPDAVFNLGHSRVFLGIAVNDLRLSLTGESDPIPVNPEFGEPEWDDNDGMGVADVLILPEDVNGQALDPENLYYRVFFCEAVVVFGELS